MTLGTVHTVRSDLHLVEGHHPHNLWDDPDLPTIVVYRSGSRLYLLDTGAGPVQRDALRGVANQYRHQVSDILLLNSHGHLDHLGNNDILSELDWPGVRRQHYFPRAARPALDFESFFGAMYKRGIPYFDYTAGLSVPPDGIASLLRALGAPAGLSGEDVALLGKQITDLGLLPAVGGFLPSIVVDILLQTYPAVHPSVETMTDYEDLGPAEEILIGESVWTGWSFTDEHGRPEVQVLQSGGHSAGGVIFYLPEHKFVMLADETTSVPIWADSDPRKTIETARRAISMIDTGHLELLCAGHRPMTAAHGDEARAALAGIVRSGAEFTAVVEDTISRFPDGVCIDDLYDVLVREAQPNSTIALLARLQFPVFSTFLKLTVLNHCLLHDLPNSRDDRGRPTFRLV